MHGEPSARGLHGCGNRDAAGPRELEGHPPVWIVEDEPASAKLAADMCEPSGAEPSISVLVTRPHESDAIHGEAARGTDPVLRSSEHEGGVHAAESE